MQVIPTSYLEYNECVKFADSQNYKHAYCKLNSTLIDRTFEDPISLFTAGLTVFTVLLSVVGFTQAGLFYWQISLQRRQFEAEHRPWLSVRVCIGPKGLYFDANGANLHVIAVCKNVGSSPARNVTINIIPIFTRKIGPVGSIAHQEQILNAQRKITKSARDRPYHPWMTSRVLFNNDEFTEERAYSFCSHETLDAIIAEYGGSGQILMSTLAVAGCVDYRFPFGDDIHHHQTGFAYHVQRLRKGAQGVVAFTHPSRDLPPNELVLSEWHQGAAFFAD